MFNKRFLRKLIRLQAFLLAAMMVIGMAQPSVEAYADDPDYRYKVRIFSGNQGTIEGEDMIEDYFENLPIGTECTIQVEPTSGKSTLTLAKGKKTKTYEIKLKDNSKYYVKGIRESGRDNNIALANPKFTVTQDMDYVIAYGVKGKMVKFTIRFKDESGKPLADSEEYYGKIGDKPVVAAPYIEGYVPDANNKTGTLKEKESGNVWTFTYSKKPAQSNSRTVTKTITTTKTTTRRIVNNTTTEDDDDEDAEEEDDEDESEADESSDNTPEAAEDVPDIVDIDEEETSEEEDSDESEIEVEPEEESEIESVETETIAETTDETVAQTESETRETIDIRDTRKSKSGLPTVAKAGIGIGVLGAVAGGVWYFLNKRKNP